MKTPDEMQQHAPIDLYDYARLAGIVVPNDPSGSKAASEAYPIIEAAGWKFAGYDPTFGTELYVPPSEK